MPAASKLSPALGLLLVVIAATLFAGWFSLHSSYMHWRFDTRAFDLANYEHAFWNTLQGRFLRTTYLEGDTFLSNHFSPALVLPIAAFAAVSRTETILVFQATSLAAAALPLYAFVRRRQGVLVATLFALAYLMSPATQLPIFYDYHDVSMLPLAVFASFWALDARRIGLASLALLLTATCKEEGALLAAGVVIFAIRERKLPPAAWAVAALLVVYFAVVKAVVMPWLAGGHVVHSFYYAGLLPPSNGEPGAAVRSLLASPLCALHHAAGQVFTAAKLRYFLQLFGPLLFLPLIAPRNLTFLAVPLAILFLATRSMVCDLTFQYNFYLLPFLFAGAAVALADRWSARTRTSLAATMLVLACLENLYYGPLLQRADTRIRFGQRMRYDFTAGDADRYARVMQVLERIPAEASVAASETLGPHLTHREVLHRSSEPPRGDDAHVVWASDLVGLSPDLYESVFHSSDLAVWTRRELDGATWFAGVDQSASLFEVFAARQDWGELRRDASVEGRPLSVGGVRYEKGYGTHAASEIRLRFSKAARSLRGKVGIDDEARAPGGAVFVVTTADGIELFRSGFLKQGMPAQPFRVDVTGLGEIVLAAEIGADDHRDDAHADWLDLELDS